MEVLWEPVIKEGQVLYFGGLQQGPYKLKRENTATTWSEMEAIVRVQKYRHFPQYFEVTQKKK